MFRRRNNVTNLSRLESTACRCAVCICSTSTCDELRSGSLCLYLCSSRRWCGRRGGSRRCTCICLTCLTLSALSARKSIVVRLSVTKTTSLSSLIRDKRSCTFAGREATAGRSTFCVGSACTGDELSSLSSSAQRDFDFVSGNFLKISLLLTAEKSDDFEDGSHDCLV